MTHMSLSYIQQAANPTDLQASNQEQLGSQQAGTEISCIFQCFKTLNINVVYQN